MDDLIRLNKALSQAGYCSRRKADILIENGDVLVNGTRAVTGQKVLLSDAISIGGKRIAVQTDFVYLAFHKPVGVTCTTDFKDPDNIIDYINYPERIFHIGRLDKDSEGLIFLTNDGDIVNKILRAENGHEKEYIVHVNKNITDAFIEQMRNGVPVLGELTQPCSANRLHRRTFKIILKQGLNRQIRRMCDYLGYEVKSLKRTRIMNIPLGSLPCGEWRYFTEEELGVMRGLFGE